MKENPLDKIKKVKPQDLPEFEDHNCKPEDIREGKPREKWEVRFDKEFRVSKFKTSEGNLFFEIEINPEEIKDFIRTIRKEAIDERNKEIMEYIASQNNRMLHNDMGKWRTTLFIDDLLDFLNKKQ